MSSNTEITVSQLARLIGTPDAPRLIDVRTDDLLSADPRMIPGSVRRNAALVEDWGPALIGRPVVVSCAHGGALSQGAAAWLRSLGVAAETLEGGFDAWRDAAAPMLVTDHLPPRDRQGRTVWITRARPKIDRIACPWLIRRFIDPDAVFLYVDAKQVAAVAEKFQATPFDVEGVFWSHRGEQCSFDTMVQEFGLRIPALDRLATIIRAADTDRLSLAPQAAGLLAAALGLSRMYKDDLAQLEASLSLYDAFYRWCRDAVGETHDWPART